MNWGMFAAFLVITAVLIVTPGPIVTLVIATGARQGIRAALVTVAGTSLGNAVLLAAIALGLSWVLQNAAALFEVLRFVGAAYLIWLGIQAWRHAGELKPAEMSGRVNFTRLRGGAVESEDHRILHGLPAAIRRSETACGDPAPRHVRGHCAVRGAVGFGLGDCVRHGPCLVHAAGAGEIARPDVRGRADGRRHLAVARPADGLTLQ